MTPEEVRRLVEAARWYHSFELLPGLVTRGSVPMNPGEVLQELGVAPDLSGKKALDIGAWDGPLTFALESRGASVTAMDIQDPSRTGFDTARAILGSAARYLRSSVYELAPEEHGRYDLIFFMGVYYHLRHPVMAFQRIHRALEDGGTLYFEGAVLDYAFNVDPSFKSHEQAIRDTADLPLTFFTNSAYAGDWSNWFVPNAACLREWLRATGFKDIEVHTSPQNSRAYGHAVRDSAYQEVEHALV